ncbi:MAG: polymer-forming cytoskeletal protein [Candidatus Thermoplasmatota archaeon]|nr:polymer-forming cytoskeletal protein [Candidatus Thermoplasmatota archaeon]
MVLPDGTHFSEHTLESQGDIVLGDRVHIEYGLTTPGSVFLGENVDVGGAVTAGGDVRIDLFSTLRGEVEAAGSAYLGEGVRVCGRLSVEEDLDVGDDVTLEEGFEARGWINIRSPIPVVVYMFAYLLQLLRQGRSEEVETILAQLEETEETFRVSDTFFFVPPGSRVGLQESTIKGGLRTGTDCRILGNFQVDESARLSRGTELHGSLRARGNVHLGPDVVVHGDLEAWGEVTLGENAVIHGKLEAKQAELMPGAQVHGTIMAPEGVQFLTPASLDMKQRVEDFNDGVQQFTELLD